MAYKLSYFDLRGRGEPIRLIFAVAGQQYEDIRVKGEDFPKLKPTLPWGQLPILQVGDKTIAQTTTILRFLARRFNLAGQDEFAVAKCEELVEAMVDLQAPWIKIMFEEKDETKKAELLKVFLEETLPKYLETFDKIQTENGGNFFVGPSVTWADVWIGNGLDIFVNLYGANILHKYPNLKKMKTAFFAIPSVKEYVENKRPAN